MCLTKRSYVATVGPHTPQDLEIGCENMPQPVFFLQGRCRVRLFVPVVPWLLRSRGNYVQLCRAMDDVEKSESCWRRGNCE